MRFLPDLTSSIFLAYQEIVCPDDKASFHLATELRMPTTRYELLS